MDGGNPQEIAAVLDSAGFPGQKMLEKTQAPEMKEALKNETTRAIQKGVFGIPTMIIDDELF